MSATITGAFRRRKRRGALRAGYLVAARGSDFTAWPLAVVSLVFGLASVVVAWGGSRRDYPSIVAATPHIEPGGSRVVWIVLAVATVLGAATLVFGFMLR